MFILGGIVTGLVVVTILMALLFRTVVPTNEVHIVQTSKKTTSYGKGKTSNVYFNWPSWVPVIGNTCIKLPVSVFGINLNGFEAYDCDRLPFLVDIKAFFRISESNIAAERVSNINELNAQLEAILQGAARTILASSDIGAIMEGRSEYGDKFTDEVNGQLEAWGVTTVKSIELMDIRDGRDSQVIANIMDKKKSEIERDSRMTVAENKKQAQIKETEALRDSQVAKEQAQQQIGIRSAEKEREVGIANEAAQQQIQAAAKDTTIAEMEVKREAETREAEITKSVAITKATEDKEKVAINAEAQKINVERAAEAKLFDQQKEAEGIQAVGKANADAAMKMEMANVDPQIALAKEIGENEGYQSYLIELRNVEANEKIGVENAGALAKADLRILANSIPGAVNKLTDIATPEGGASLAGSLESFAHTEAGASLMKKFGVTKDVLDTFSSK